MKHHEQQPEHVANHQEYIRIDQINKDSGELDIAKQTQHLVSFQRKKKKAISFGKTQLYSTQQPTHPKQHSFSNPQPFAHPNQPDSGRNILINNLNGNLNISFSSGGSER